MCASAGGACEGPQRKTLYFSTPPPTHTNSHTPPPPPSARTPLQCAAPPTGTWPLPGLAQTRRCRFPGHVAGLAAPGQTFDAAAPGTTQATGAGHGHGSAGWVTLTQCSTALIAQHSDMAKGGGEQQDFGPQKLDTTHPLPCPTNSSYAALTPLPPTAPAYNTRTSASSDAWRACSAARVARASACSVATARACASASTRLFSSIMLRQVRHRVPQHTAHKHTAQATGTACARNRCTTITSGLGSVLGRCVVAWVRAGEEGG